MLDWLVEAGQWLLGWIADLGSAAASAAFSGVTAVAQIPTADLQPYVGLLGVANRWVPLEELVGLLVIYWGFVGAFATAKLVLKLIPTVG
jgi:hypothetical protein